MQINEDLYTLENLEMLVKKQKKIKQQCLLIQNEFDFTIPDYLLEEILKYKTSKDYYKLCLFINIAVINNRLTNENANILKENYLLNKENILPK